MVNEFEEIIIELSYNCNLSCSMCGFGREQNPFNTNKFLSFPDYKTILNQFGGHTKVVRLNGRGESTIHPDLIDILNYTKDSYPNIGVNLFSNFSFKNDDVINGLIKNNVQLFISMDSPVDEELKDIRRGCNPDLIKSNIDKIKDITPRPFIIFTLQETNYHRIYDIAEFSHQNNCHIMFNTVRRDVGIEKFIEVVKTNKNHIIHQFNMVKELYSGSGLNYMIPDQVSGIDLFEDTSTKTHGKMDFCPALTKELCILYDGTVTPCNMFNPYEYGNIMNESFDQIWDGEKRLNFIKDHKNHYYCNNCSNMGV